MGRFWAKTLFSPLLVTSGEDLFFGLHSNAGMKSCCLAVKKLFLCAISRPGISPNSSETNPGLHHLSVMGANQEK